MSDQIGCPSCGTILNAKAAGCADPWHHGNPPPATGGIVEGGMPEIGSGCTRPPKLFTRPSPFPPGTRITAAHLEPLGPTRADLDAAYARGHADGVAEGRRQAITALARTLGHGLVTDVAEADLEPWFRAALQTAYERGRREATEGWERRWSVRDQQGHVSKSGFTEAGARARAAETGGTFVTRLVGPWKDVEQRRPCDGCGIPLCEDGRCACLKPAVLTDEQAGTDRG